MPKILYELYVRAGLDFSPISRYGVLPGFWEGALESVRALLCVRSHEGLSV